MVRKLSRFGSLLIVLAGAAARAAVPMPLFGPATFQRTSGEQDVHTETLASPLSGAFVLFVRNGEGESHRVASATVELNGTLVVGPGELNENVPGLRRDVQLQAGPNTLTVTLRGEPGSFVTLAIVRPGQQPVFVVGRLVLAWADGPNDLVLALKNGSHQGPRLARVVFFTPEGQVAAVSERIALPPRASLRLHAPDLLDGSSWAGGSIEVLYAGPGVARVFGSAFFVDATTGDGEALPLEQAGLEVFRGEPEAVRARFQRSLGR